MTFQRYKSFPSISARMRCHVVVAVALLILLQEDVFGLPQEPRFLSKKKSLRHNKRRRLHHRQRLFLQRGGAGTENDNSEASDGGGRPQTFFGSTLSSFRSNTDETNNNGGTMDFANRVWKQLESLGKTSTTAASSSTNAATTTAATATATTTTSLVKQQRQRLVNSWKENSSRFMSAVGPAAVATLELFYRPGTGVTLFTFYALALLGSSSGFYLFLYFITIGYAMGVILPLTVALVVYNLQQGGGKMPLETNLHTLTTILWGVRLGIFCMHREYIGWPQLHQKIVEVNRMARVSSKIFCWLVYSVLYVALATPCWSRLQLSSSSSWGPVGRVALVVQSLGLVLETVADYQKSVFKSRPGQRNQWCHEGLWRWSTHPNYLGEWLFWCGTYAAGMAAYQSPLQWILSTLGWLFVSVVLRGATKSLGAKQERKYGSTNAAFVEFQQTHCVVGPIPPVLRRNHNNNNNNLPTPIGNTTTIEDSTNENNQPATPPPQPLSSTSSSTSTTTTTTPTRTA